MKESSFPAGTRGNTHYQPILPVQTSSSPTQGIVVSVFSRSLAASVSKPSYRFERPSLGSPWPCRDDRMSRP